MQARSPSPTIGFREHHGEADGPTMASKEQALLSLSHVAWFCLDCHHHTRVRLAGRPGQSVTSTAYIQPPTLAGAL